MKHTISVIFMSFLMLGCGGSGGSDSGAATTPLAVTDNSQTEAVPAPDQPQSFITEIHLQDNEPSTPVKPDDIVESLAQSSREIVVPDNFNLNSERILDLRVTRSEYDMQPAYLSLCTDYKRDAEGGYIINYDSCLLRAALSDNEYETTITIN